ncbi:hypothetical protein BC829DRAFT_363323 [Chytridium lagenaria]|nr:hypothetical protein BC829DRAFT_363323 [Chytridium lagenaria]
MRFIPLTIDVVLVATLFAGVRRAGNLDFRIDRIQNIFLRWTLLQLVFIGDAVLDAAIQFAQSYPYFFEAKSAKPPVDSSALAVSMLSAMVGGIGSVGGLIGGLGGGSGGKGWEEKIKEVEEEVVKPTAPSGAPDGERMKLRQRVASGVPGVSGNVAAAQGKGKKGGQGERSLFFLMFRFEQYVFLRSFYQGKCGY